MDVQSTTLLVLGILAVLMTVQTILLLVFVVSLRTWFRRTSTLIDGLSQGAAPVLEAARELLVETRTKITSLADNLNEISLLAKGQVTRLDGFLKDTTERAQMQVVRLDGLVGDTMNRVAETTEAVQQGVLLPLREIAAIVAGIRASLEFLFHRNRKTVERATQDEELFI